MVALLEIDRGSRLRLDCLVFASLSLSRVFVPAIRCVWRRHVDFLEQEKKTGHNSFIGHWRAFERLKSTIMVTTILTTSSRGTPVVSHTEIARMWDYLISVYRWNYYFARGRRVQPQSLDCSNTVERTSATDFSHRDAVGELIIYPQRSRISGLRL